MLLLVLLHTSRVELPEYIGIAACRRWSGVCVNVATAV